MPTDPATPITAFTRDVIGRYVCNGLDEALRSTDPTRPFGRSFDFIVIGGGTFGSAVASRLFGADAGHFHRVLVLEAGQMLFTEHAQNQPMLDTVPEAWGTPWASDSPQGWNQVFPGLAYCIGGRSLFWGGWSPYFIDSELPSPPWPAEVVKDFRETVLQLPDGPKSYLDVAASQIGSDDNTDYVDGALHQALRQRLFTGLQARSQAGQPLLTGNRGALGSANDLEAPLAVQSKPPRAGFFPINKFSAAQLLIKASRMAQEEAQNSASGSLDERNLRKRLMVVPNCHVIRLDRLDKRIMRVVTNQGTIDVPAGGRVILAMGTIENTRLALHSVPNSRGLIGRNLMAHLRSNVTLRVPRASIQSLLGPNAPNELQVSALFVKGRHTRGDGSLGHFHVQITASGTGKLGMSSEAELFKKIPDIDTLEAFRGLTDQWVVITLRGIGEMVGDRQSVEPLNRVKLDGVRDGYDYGMARALVRLEASAADLELWQAMDQACDEIAQMFAGGQPIQFLSKGGSGSWQDQPPSRDNRRDTLSSTHHEGGTLWMGEDPATSVTDPIGRFHELENLYAVGPALLPTLGSPNPMLSGVALSRRLADRLVKKPDGVALAAGTKALFDGTERTFRNWKAAGRGTFALIDGAIVAEPGGDLGLLYYAADQFDNFKLSLQFRLDRRDDNSGVFVRSRDPGRPVPDRNNPAVTYAYDNPAYVPVTTGYEIQIDEQARPDGFAQHRTGAIYNVPVGTGPNEQDYRMPAPVAAGVWHDLEITVVNDTFTVRLDGELVTKFTNHDPYRGLSFSQDPHSGFVGLQAHTGRVSFRSITAQRLNAIGATLDLEAEAARQEVGR